MAGPVSHSNYNFVAVIPKIARATKPKIRELANTAVEIAKSPGFSPKKTGHNASTITMDEGGKGELGFRVYTQSGYGGYLEVFHKTLSRYLRRALEKASQILGFK